MQHFTSLKLLLNPKYLAGMEVGIIVFFIELAPVAYPSMTTLVV